MPFTLAVYMVRGFESTRNPGGEVTEAAVGSATGMLAAVFCAAQLVTSYPWGMISDRVGRKPVMLVGNLSCVLSTLWFGLAGSYKAAVASRAVGGAFNAIILAEKSILGEGIPRASQAEGFGLLSLCWGLGSLVGPMMGGSLSAPCTSALRIGALCHEGSLLVQRPYFLPCLLAAAMSAAATVMVALDLEETVPSRRRSAGAAGGGSSGARYQPVPAAEADERRDSSSKSRELELRHLPSLPGGLPGGKEDQGMLLRAFRGDSARGNAALGIDGSLVGYGLIAFMFNLLDEVTPIWASADVSNGGLGFAPAELAPSLSFGGAVLVVWALHGFPWLSGRLGVLRVLRLGLWHTAPLALLTPCASLFHGARLPSQALMFAALGFKAVAGTNAFTGCLILVNEAAPVQSLGAVNGAGQSLASLVRAAGPALGGLTWGWSSQLAATPWWPSCWLPHQFLPFALVAALAAATDLAVYARHEPPAPEELLAQQAGEA
ncbi:MFS general substrate transporter [Micractinium conductrix]|uniref:MFS general substrate transporter n=1 Tax=Micractinium conductrix TaxID=554055 RepID=A0A2P6VS88_9CHLO|nr:MFS general substrate transporter [Micractinium conductrix]|eukprot:PSC76968.1 MFS general substrate transporter [Micractinium conductrix]